ncbi:MAG: hypothetical protein N3A01_03605 [Bacteroidales bacterium]|nr:hypothetical protein [Bacteroidales bacterium]
MIYFITIENNTNYFDRLSNYACIEYPQRLIFKCNLNRVFNVGIIDTNKNLNIKDFIIEYNNNIYFIYSKIYNKNDLKRRLNIHQNEVISDTFLFFKYFNHKGVNGLKDIIGKWIILVYNLKLNEIQIARDHTGWRNVYYIKLNEGFIFSNSFVLLSKINNSDENINFYYLASLCVGDYGNPDETCFKNINKVSPATAITLNKNLVKKNIYWNVKDLSIIDYSDYDSYRKHFINLLTEVLKEQLPLNENISTTLSSGLDSSFITSFIANVFYKKQLYAITSIPLYNNDVVSNRLTNEYELAKYTSRKYKNIIHLTDNAENINPLEGIKISLKIHGYPLRNSSNQYWILSIYNKLCSLNINNLIWAQNGNLTISWPFDSAVLSKKTLKKFIKQKIISLNLLKQPYLLNSYFNSEFIKKYKLDKYFLETNYNPYYISFNLNKTRLYFFNFFQKIGYSYLEEKTNYFNIENYDPTSDPRVIEFCFSLPQKLYLKNGEHKIFYRLISHNIVADEIVNNKQKGKQAADLHLRIENFKTEIYEILNDSINSPTVSEIFNVKQLILDFSENKITNYEKFMRVLNVIFFLRMKHFF